MRKCQERHKKWFDHNATLWWSTHTYAAYHAKLPTFYRCKSECSSARSGKCLIRLPICEIVAKCRVKLRLQNFVLTLENQTKGFWNVTRGIWEVWQFGIVCSICMCTAPWSSILIKSHVMSLLTFSHYLLNTPRIQVTFEACDTCSMAYFGHIIRWLR